MQLEKDEVFPNPTVKTVIFQIRYPNLFYIESRIGDIQVKIMDDFPESSLLFSVTLAQSERKSFKCSQNDHL
jgi:hypothetical protein